MKSLLITLLLLVGSTAVLMAQPPPILDGPAQVPIDGGLSLLALAGTAYAIKKLKQDKMTQ